MTARRGSLSDQTPPIRRNSTSGRMRRMRRLTRSRRRKRSRRMMS